MRYQLSDKEWSIVRTMLPTKPRGVSRVDDRRVLNGIFWVLRCSLAEASSPLWSSYHLLQSFSFAGGGPAPATEDAGPDGSMVGVHQHAACIADSGNQAIGRSRGGLTSKLHVVVDRNGLPLRLGITAGQAHDNRLCSTLLSGLAPRAMLLADRGYDAGWITTLVNKQGAWANIPPKRNRREPICFQPSSLSCAQLHREVLQQDQALPAHCHSLPQARGQLLGIRPAGIDPALAARL